MTTKPHSGTSAGSVMPAQEGTYHFQSEPVSSVTGPPLAPPATQRGFYGLVDRLGAAAERMTRAGHNEDARVYLAVQSRLAEMANDLPAAINAAINDEDESLKTALSFLRNTI